MLLNTDYLLPAELTGYVRQAAADWDVNQFQLAQWLPNRFVDDLEYRFDRGGEGLIDAATFRSYDAESPIGSRPGVTRVTGELPPLSRKIRLGEYERLRQRRLDQALADALMADAERMARAIVARMELARGDALTNGSVTIAENGMSASVNFGRDSGNSVAPSTLWSDTVNATPLVDMLTWRDAYAALVGQDPGVALTSRRVLGYLLRNAEIRALASSLAGTPAIVPESGLQMVLAAHGLPPIRIYDAQVNVGGSATRVIADDKVLFLPGPGNSDDPASTQLGATLWGTTAEAMEPGYQIEDGAEPGIVAGVYRTEDPVALWTKAAGIGLPVLANPNLSMRADVA